MHPVVMLTNATLQRLNLLRLTIRQNPLHRSNQNSHPQDLCASLASQIIEAIAAFADSITNIEPCGFFFSTALVECIYHLIFTIQDSSSPTERPSSISSLKLSYQLLVLFSRTLDTAKRAIRALDSTVFPGARDDSLVTNHQQHGETGNLNVKINGIGTNSHLFDSIGNMATCIADDLPVQDNSLFHNGTLGDMSLFAFLDGAADEDFQYNNTGQQQTPPNMGSGFWDMMHSLDGDGALDSGLI